MSTINQAILTMRKLTGEQLSQLSQASATLMNRLVDQLAELETELTDEVVPFASQTLVFNCMDADRGSALLWQFLAGRIKAYLGDDCPVAAVDEIAHILPIMYHNSPLLGLAERISHAIQPDAFGTDVAAWNARNMTYLGPVATLLFEAGACLTTPIQNGDVTPTDTATMAEQLDTVYGSLAIFGDADDFTDNKSGFSWTMVRSLLVSLMSGMFSDSSAE